MKNKRLYESFAEEIKMARDLRYRDYNLMSEQRRQRRAAGYLEAHNGEWFSCYDLYIEKNQCWTVLSDILLTFGYAYRRYLDKSPYCMRIFVERCTNGDISEIKSLTRMSLMHKKYKCNFYEVDLNNVRTEAEFTRLHDEIASSETPAVVFIDADNFTYDKFVTGQLDEGEIGKIIDDLTEQLLPQSGLLIYMERYPKYDADEYGNGDPYAYDDPNRNAKPEEPEEYPEGYGTMEIDFDNVNESRYAKEGHSQIDAWTKRNSENFRAAVNIFADYIINEYVDMTDFKTAIDIDECDGFDFQNFSDIADYYMNNSLHKREWNEIVDRVKHPYRIKELVDEYYLPNEMVDIWEAAIDDGWNEILENNNREDLIEAIYDLQDVASVTNKYAYGGGGYEIMRDLELATVEEVGDRIKAKCSRRKGRRK